MKILLVSDYLNDPRLGSSKVPIKLQSEFLLSGHNCDVLFSEDLGRFPSNRHVRQAISPMLAARKILLNVRQNGGYDVIDVASADAWMFGVLRRFGVHQNTVLVSRSNGLEHLNYRRTIEDHHHGLSHLSWKSRIWFPVVRLSQVWASAKLADCLLLINDNDREFVLRNRWKKSEDIAVVPHGVSSGLMANTRTYARGRGFLFCGTWDGVKGIDYLAPAFDHFIRTGPPLNLTVLGGSVPESTIRAAFSGEAQKFLTIVDRVQESEVMHHYQTHDALIFCSTYEGFGMVLIEAMSQGLACIATPLGAGSMVKDGYSGLVVPTRDSKAIAAAMRRLANNSGLRIQLGEQAKHQVANLTWTNTAKRTLEVYQYAQEKRFVRLKAAHT